ncbi:MAG TPA: hypothetical protein VI685_26525 [Candidatus Angelobacter sp.]
MKIGAEDKKKVILMGVLLVVAIPLAIHSFNFGSSDASANQPAAAATAGTNPAPPRRPGLKVRENTLDPTLHTDLLAASQKAEYPSGSRNIFRMAEPPPEKIPPVIGNVHQPPPPPPQDPPKPQIPLIFYGFSNRPGEPKKAFLKDNDNIFVAVEGEVVERRYKIVKITNTFILVEDILNNNQQTINLTLPQASG